MRSENLFSDRINILEKEVSRLEVQILQNKQIESELREKNEQLRQRNDQLQLDVFKMGDAERKTSIELQIKANQLKQELDVSSSHFKSQTIDLSQQLQTAILAKDKLQLELTQATERAKHDLEMLREKTDLENHKGKIALERQL